MNVEVYHNTHVPHETDDGSTHIPFLTPACEHCLFTLAYIYETDLNLEHIWMENQRIEGEEAELPVRFGTRSLSVGDLVKAKGEVWLVQMIGWTPAGWEPATT